MPKLDNELYLHPSCQPLEEVYFNEDQLDLFTLECDGWCGL